MKKSRLLVIASTLLVGGGPTLFAQTLRCDGIEADPTAIRMEPFYRKRIAVPQRSPGECLRYSVWYLEGRNQLASGDAAGAVAAVREAYGIADTSRRYGGPVLGRLEEAPHAPGEAVLALNTLAAIRALLKPPNAWFIQFQSDVDWGMGMPVVPAPWIAAILQTPGNSEEQLSPGQQDALPLQDPDGHEHRHEEQNGAVDEQGRRLETERTK